MNRLAVMIPFVFCADWLYCNVAYFPAFTVLLHTTQLKIHYTTSLIRFVLKRQGSDADAGIWIMRGLALAAMGEY